MQFNFIRRRQIKKDSSIASTIHQPKKESWRIDRISWRLTFQFNHHMGNDQVFRQALRHRFGQYLVAGFAVCLLQHAVAPFGILVALESIDHPHSCGYPLLALNSVVSSHQRRRSQRSYSENPRCHRCEALHEAT